MSAAVSGRLGKLGLAGFGLWCAIFAASFWPHYVSAGEKIVLEIKVADARIDRQTGLSIIFVKVSEESKRQMAELSQRNVGKTTEVRVEGRTIMKPVFREPLLGGVFEISGGHTLDEAKAIAKQMTSGAKVELEVVD